MSMISVLPTCCLLSRHILGRVEGAKERQPANSGGLLTCDEFLARDCQPLEPMATTALNGRSIVLEGSSL